MKIRGLALVAALIILALPKSVNARTPTILLWAPGAEGSAEQAAPLLQSWADYIKRKSGDQISLKFAYQNESVESGISKLKKTKPVAGIISLDAYLVLSDQLPLSLLIQTRKLPKTDGTQSYVLLKRAGSHDPTSIVLSEPLNEGFVRKILLQAATLPYKNLPLQYEAQILKVLKSIAHGERNDAILITSYQAATLKKLSAPWTQQLTQVLQSPILPSPPFVTFDKWAGKFSKEPFAEILLNMSQDAQGKEILQELRLAGFMRPNEAAYLKWKQIFNQ